MMKILLSWFVTYHYIVCVDNIDRQRDALYWCINIINIIICLVWATTTTSVVVDKDELKNHPLLIIIIKCVDQDARQYSQYKHTGHTPHTHTQNKKNIILVIEEITKSKFAPQCRVGYYENWVVTCEYRIILASKNIQKIKRMSLLSIVYRLAENY